MLLLLLLSAALGPTAAITAATNSDPVTFEIDEEVPTGTQIGNLNHRLRLMDGTTFKPFFWPEKWKPLLSLDAASGLVATSGRQDREALCPMRRDPCKEQFSVLAQPPPATEGGSGRDSYYSFCLLLRDINDNRPRFKTQQIKINISESAMVGTLYSLSVAEDIDGIEEHRRTNYDLKPEDAEASVHFRLTEQDSSDPSGAHKKLPKLELVKSLDRETRDHYRYWLIASEAQFQNLNQTDQLVIDVHVQDANDNAPSWPEKTATVTLAECDPLHRSLLLLCAHDPDLNERITYSIAPTAVKEVATAFYIYGAHLMQNRSLDYENPAEQALVIPVVAEDSGRLRSETEVSIRLTDCNDNYPTIELRGAKNNEVNLTENDSSERTLAQVKASDADSGNNGSVHCRAAGQPAGHFCLVPVPQSVIGQTRLSVIYELRKPAGVSFDREAEPRRQASVVVICSDQGSPPKENRHPLTVRIIDVNDNEPRLKPSFYQFKLRENSPVNAFVGAVVAEDPDDPSTPLRFELDTIGRQYFNIKSTSRGRAEIRARIKFDREEHSEYNFAVIVSDSDGGPVSLSATATVKVVIEDVDDSPPVFHPTEYNFRVVEDFGANISRRLIGTVTATDADLDANAKFRYRVGSSHSTAIDFFFEDGRLYGSGNFDRERYETLSLVVLAVGAEMSSSAQVTITLLDVNDNLPILEGIRQVYNLSAASPAGTQLLPQVRGRDEDFGENGTIVYGLEEMEVVGSDGVVEGGGPYFSVDKMHGMVTLIQTFKRGIRRRFRLTLLVKDRGLPPMESRHVTYVHIVDAVHATRPGVGGAGIRDDDGRGSGAAGGRAQRVQSDRNLLLLLCLAAVVFVIFVALLAVLLYMHAWGRQETSRTAVRSNRSTACYDRANTEPPQITDDPSADLSDAAAAPYPDILLDGAGRRSATLVIDNAGARMPGTGMKQLRKFSSSGYLTVPTHQHQQHQQQQQQPPSTSNAVSTSMPEGGRQRQQQCFALKAFNGYEQTIAPSTNVATASASTSDKISRKFYGTLAGGGAGCVESSPRRLTAEDSRYASAARVPAIDRQGYAVLAGDTPMTEAGLDASLGSPVCRTPYATSSFV